MDAKRPTPRHIIIKVPKVKDKERMLKAAKEKKLVTYRGVPIRLSADFSKETLQGGRRGRMGEKMQGLRSIIGKEQNRQREVKNSLGSGEAKEHTQVTHGHEQRWRGGDGWRERGYQVEGGKGEKNQDNCNNIINKIYFKNF